MKADRIAQVASELAATYERHYHTCGQCTLAAIEDALGVHDDGVFRSASCFGAGIGKLGDGSCGGYLGATMAIGHLFGRPRDKFDDDPETMEIVNQAAVALHRQFLVTYGSVACRSIQEKVLGRPYDLWNPAERAAFEEAGGHRDKCPGVVANAAQWGAQLILAEMERRGLTLRQLKRPRDPWEYGRPV